MPSSDHATVDSDGAYCCNCSSAVGTSAKCQPTDVEGEIFCPRCFVWKRMLIEPERFNASQAAAVKCQFCAWTTVCFGARPGAGLVCSHCGKGGAMRVPIVLDSDDFKRSFPQP